MCLYIFAKCFTLSWMEGGKGKGVKTLLHHLVYGYCFSIIDEIYQLFIPGRSGEARDVFLDNVGIILGLLFAAFSIFLFKKVRRKIINIFKKYILQCN